MENRKFNSGLDAIYLVSCAVNGIIPDKDALEKVDYEALIKQLKRHSLQAMAYLAIKKYTSEYGTLPSGLSEDVVKVWEAVYKRAVSFIVAYSMEREKILAYFEEKGIWYLPLKGIYMQNFYPEIGMRQMADNDIYFDIKYRKDVRKYMEKNGYKVENYAIGVHDTYQKAPFYNFEMHAYLYRESVNPVFNKYYENVKARLIKDTDNKYGYHFSDEDFYIHTITHIYKHYTHGGLGIRFLSDVCLFLRSKKETFDWTYIASELEKLELTDFESMVRNLSEKIFSKECVFWRDNVNMLTEDEQTQLEFFIKSGIYGTKEQSVKSSMERMTGNTDVGAKNKARYVMKRLFPDKLYYEENYPFLHKHKVFIPFFVVYRIFRGVFVRTKNVTSEIRALNKNK